MRAMLLVRTIAVALVCGLTVNALSEGTSPVDASLGKRMRIIFRYDDYSQKSATTGFESNLLSEFTRHKIPCTFGVIPFVCSNNIHNPEPQPLLPLDRKKSLLLKDAISSGIVEVAQHGWSHQALPGCSSNHWSEFVGSPIETQVEHIQKGKSHLAQLFGREPTIFIPPWNSYDLNTLEAVARCGFTVFSSDVYGLPHPSSLKIVPATTELRNLKTACAALRLSPDPDAVIVVLFHEYDFKALDSVRGYMDLQSFSKLLDWVAAQPDIETVTFDAVGRADSTRYTEFQSMRSLHRLLPGRVLRLFGLESATDAYPSLSESRRLIRGYWRLIVPFYLGLFAAAVLAGRMAKGWLSPRLDNAFLLSLLLAFTCLAIFLILRHSVTGKGLCLGVALVGVGLGVWSKVRKPTTFGLRP